MNSNDPMLPRGLKPASESPVDVRLRISALWVAMLFVFAYVDLFSLYRPDVRAELATGELAGFEVTQGFLFSVTLFIVIPSLMVYLSLVMPRKTNRIVNQIVAVLYAVASLGSAVGEGGYYILGGIVEAVLLGLVVHHSRSWVSAADTDAVA